jgi:surface polysaccharide O-acyltransferase-like enzyme
MCSYIIVRKTGILTHVSGFGYNGLMQICVAILIVTVAYLFPLEWIPQTIKKMIIGISKYTLGIYCIHLLVIHYLNYIMDSIGITMYRYLPSVIAFLLSLLLSYLIALLPFHLSKKLVM